MAHNLMGLQRLHNRVYEGFVQVRRIRKLLFAIARGLFDKHGIFQQLTLQDTIHINELVVFA